MVKRTRLVGSSMSETDRDESGRFTETVTEQEILKVFDQIEEPFVTASELADELGVSRQAANYRLKRMRDNGLVNSKKTGARSVGWWAEVAPRLSAESKERVSRSREEISRGESVTLEEL
jgi:predicted ArsR family transcriptional regulator